MLTYPKSTMRIRCIPMHLSSGHVNLMPGKFYLPSNFPQSDLGAGRTHVGLCPKFLVLTVHRTSTFDVSLYLNTGAEKFLEAE